MENATPVRDRLKKKARSKNQKNEPENELENLDIFKMMQKVTKVLQQNPEMINKVNKMVSGLMNNKDLIGQLSSQLQEDQTLESKSETESLQATSGDSKQ